MKAELAGRPVSQEVLKAEADALEGQVIPRNIGGIYQRDFETLVACLVLRSGEVTPIKQMDLIDFGDVDEDEGRLGNDFGATFFKCFAHGPLCGRFAVFHESGRKCPIAIAWLNGAPTKQDLFFPGGNATNNQARVFVVHVPATVANMTGKGVASRNDKRYVGAATNTKLDHGESGTEGLQRVYHRTSAIPE